MGLLHGGLAGRPHGLTRHGVSGSVGAWLGLHLFCPVGQGCGACSGPAPAASRFGGTPWGARPGAGRVLQLNVDLTFSVWNNSLTYTRVPPCHADVPPCHVTVHPVMLLFFENK